MAEARKLGLGAAKRKDIGRRVGSGSGDRPGTPKGKRGRVIRRPACELPDIEIRVVAPFEPQTKKRARTYLRFEDVAYAFKVANGDPRRFMGALKSRTATPPETRRYQAQVALIATAAMQGRPPLDIPVEIEVTLRLMGDPTTWPVAYSDLDIDNGVKAAFDALNGVAWKDDRLVVRMSTIKECAESPEVVMVVRPAAD